MKKEKIQKPEKLEYIFVFLVSLLFAVLNQLHVILSWLKNPPDRLFAGITHYYTDFFLYVYYVAQGKAGNFLPPHPFTSESMRPSWIYWLNSVLGFIGGFFRLNPFTIYNISLFIFIMILIILWYVFVRTIYPKDKNKRIIAFIFVLTSTSLPSFSEWFFHNVISFPRNLWFSPAPIFNRLGGVTHQTFQTIMILLLILSYSSIVGKNMYNLSVRTVLSYVAMLVSASIVALSQPFQSALVVISCAVISFAVFLRTRQARTLLPVILVGFASVICALILYREFQIPIYNNARIWEQNQYVPRSVVFFFSKIGPVAYFLPFGIASYLKKKGTLPALYFWYGILSLFLFFSPIPSYIGALAARFLHPASYGLLPILAVEGIYGISSIVFRYLKKRTTLVCICLYAALTVPAIFAHISLRINSKNENNGFLLQTDYNHIPHATLEALSWIKGRLEKNEAPVILSDSRFRIEILVPALAGAISYTGHPLHTLQPQTKERIRERFFTAGAMSASEAAVLFKDARISFVLAENNPRNDFLPIQYSMLKLVFENEKIKIFAVSCCNKT